MSVSAPSRSENENENENELDRCKTGVWERDRHRGRERGRVRERWRVSERLADPTKDRSYAVCNTPTTSARGSGTDKTERRRARRAMQVTGQVGRQGQVAS